MINLNILPRFVCWRNFFHKSCLHVMGESCSVLNTKCHGGCIRYSVEIVRPAFSPIRKLLLGWVSQRNVSMRYMSVQWGSALIGWHQKSFALIGQTPLHSCFHDTVDKDEHIRGIHWLKKDKILLAKGRGIYANL